MASALFNLLADMAKDPKKFEAYQNNIDSLLEEYNLTEEQKELIRKGGEDNYIQLLRDERAKLFGDACM